MMLHFPILAGKGDFTITSSVMMMTWNTSGNISVITPYVGLRTAGKALIVLELDLRCHIDTSSWGGRRYLPYAFTKQGVAMLSSVLRSRRAILVNIETMWIFVRLSEILMTHKDLTRRLDDLERSYDAQFRVVFDAIRQLMNPENRRKRRIGFEVYGGS